MFAISSSPVSAADAPAEKLLTLHRPLVIGHRGYPQFAPENTLPSFKLALQAGAVVLQSTFTSIPDIGAELYPWLPVRWISTIKYNTRAILPRITAPVLVMHSRADTPKLFCEPQGGHNEAAWTQAAFREAIEKILKLVGSGTEAR